MEDDTKSRADQTDSTKVCAAYLFCDNCSFYPIQAIHGHFTCPRCHLPTKCCEGMALEED